MKTFAAAIAICILQIFTASCNQTPTTKADNTNTATAKPAVNRAEEEKSLREADVAWSVAAEKKDLDGLVSFVTDDSVQLPPNAPTAKGKEAVRKEWSNIFALKDAAVKWEPAMVQVAESGELGYTSGTYTLSFTDPKAGKIEDKGKYLEVWKKVDGKWKCHLDMYSSDIAPK